MRVDELVDFVALVGGVASSSQLKSAGFSAGLIAHASEGGRIERAHARSLLHSRCL